MTAHGSGMNCVFFGLGHNAVIFSKKSTILILLKTSRKLQKIHILLLKFSLTWMFILEIVENCIASSFLLTSKNTEKNHSNTATMKSFFPTRLNKIENLKRIIESRMKETLSGMRGKNYIVSITLHSLYHYHNTLFWNEYIYEIWKNLRVLCILNIIIILFFVILF